MRQLKPFTLHLLYHHAQYLLLRILVLRQEHQAGTILPLLRHRNTLQQYKLMRYLEHDTGSITVLTYLRTAVTHILKHLQRIVHQLVTLSAVDIHYHTHAASIVLVFTLIQPSLLFTLCHNFLS